MSGSPRMEQENALREALSSLQLRSLETPGFMTEPAEVMRRHEQALTKQIRAGISRRRPDLSKAECEERARDFVAWLFGDSERFRDVLAAPAGHAVAFLYRAVTRYIYESEPDPLRRQLRKAVATVVRQSPSFVEVDSRSVKLVGEPCHTWPETLWHPKTSRFNYAALALAIRRALTDEPSMTRGQITSVIERAILAGQARRTDERFAFHDGSDDPRDDHRRRTDAETCVSAVVEALDARELTLLEARVLGESIAAAGERLELKKTQAYALLARAQHAAETAIRMAYDGVPSLLSQEAIHEFLYLVFTIRRTTSQDQ